jgi:sugar lactone lactonase YvrE
MSKVCSGPRPSITCRFTGSVRFINLIWMLVWRSLLFLAVTQAAFAGVTEPVGTTSTTQTATLTFSTAGTLGTIAVLTQGAPNLDFNVATGGTCAVNAAYSVGQTCTVEYTFTPTHPGSRYGGVTLSTISGTLLATAYIDGTGAGPQIIFAPGKQINLGGNFTEPTGMAVDGSGNVFVTDDQKGTVTELLAASGYATAVQLGGSSFEGPWGIAVDGAGNVFVADSLHNAVKEIVAAGGYKTVQPVGSGFLTPYAVTVDGSGNIFVADTGNQAVKEIFAAGGYTTVNTLGGSYKFSNPLGIAVDQSGNVFVAASYPAAANISEIPAAGGYTTVNPVGSGLSNPIGVAVDGVGNVFVADSFNHAVKELIAASGYATVNTLGTSNLSYPSGIALDGSGNVFVTDIVNIQVAKLDYADPPSLTFATTNVGSTSSDSPQTVTITNDGNTNLTFSVPGSGTNPSITPGFTIGNTSTCPQLSTFASAATLAPGASCTDIVSFSPLLPGADNGQLISTDDNLNVAGASQIVPLKGVSPGNVLPPMVISVSPNSGPVAGGAIVTITGTNFTGTTAVSFGTTPATSFTFVSATSITATSPAGTGVVDVTVTTGGGTSPLGPGDQFTYVAPLPQTIAFTQPPPAFAGTAVLLSATGGASGNPVIFSVVSGPAVVSGADGSTLTYTGAGSVVIEADQAGNASYLAAAPVQNTVTTTILTEPLTTTSPAVPTLVTFSAAGTLSAITGLTQGKASQDFNIVPGGNCAIGTTYAAGQTCTVDFSFTPTHPGLRDGAVLLTTSAGATLANGFVYGVGNGPQIVWAPGKQVSLGSGSGIGSPTGVAIDGNGNIFIADMTNNAVEEILASTGATITLGAFPLPDDVAVDGSGNVFVISNRTTLSEMLAVDGSVPATPTIITLYTAFTALNGMKVDANGNVFVANSFTTGINSYIDEVLAVNGSIPASPTVVTIASNIGGPTGVAIDVNGNVYYSDEMNNAAYEIMAVNGTIPASPTIRMLAGGLNEPTNIALDGAGNAFVTDFGDGTVKEILAVNRTIPATPVVLTLTSAVGAPQGLTVDSSGNVLVADADTTAVVKLDYADPPSLTFATTDVGSTSIDSPQTVTMLNDGNAALTFAVPGAGNNPTITPGFTIGNSSTCPQLSATSGVATLAAGASCTDSISFTPITGGPDSGDLITTDNDLSIPGSTQIVPLNGVGIAAPIVVLTVSPNPAAFGTAVTLTATVTAAPPATGVPTGTVQFFNNGASIGTSTVSGLGAAILVTTTLPAGADAITCTYSGDANFAPAPCNAVVEQITTAPTALTLVSSVNPSPALTPVTFTAHFSANGQPVGAGNTVTFIITIPPSTVALAFPATTDATGTATFTPSGFYPGTYSVSVAYAATADYQAAAAGPITETVNLNPTSTTLTATPNPAEQNQSITIVATVTALTGTAPPNGTVTLLDGATTLGTASAVYGSGAFSTATFTFSTLVPGVHSLTAIYTPTAGNSGLSIAGIPFGTTAGAISFTASQASGYSLTIIPQDFSLTADPPSITIETQHHASMQLALTSTGGWTGPITLTCGSPLPAWITCELPKSAVTLGADATLPVSFTIDTDQVLDFYSSQNHSTTTRPTDNVGAPFIPRTLRDGWAGTLLATLLPLTLLGFGRRRKALRSLLMLASLAVFMSALTACGGNFYPGSTTPGTYIIPVTATGTAVGAVTPTTHTLNITLTVTQ